MPANTKQSKEVSDYIQAFPKDVQKILQKIRQTIAETAPEAIETISYQIPAFKLNKVTIAYFAAFKNHIGFYPPAPNAFKNDVALYVGPKGNLRFPLDKPVPYDLVKRIIEFRMEQNKEK